MKSFLISELTMLVFFLIGTLYVLEFSSGESLSDVYAKECDGTNTGLDHTPNSPINRYNIYKEQYRNCTRVKGNLEIVFSRLTDAQYDFSFLENIREVDGYVLIFGNLVPKIRLTKLRVIRGNELYHDANGEFGLFVAQNSAPNNNSVGLQELQLPSLVEILQGNVMFKGNSRLCFGENTVNWEQILLGRKVHRKVSGYEKINCSKILHGSVMFKGNSRLCFGEHTVNWEHILLGGRGHVIYSTVHGYEKINCSSGKTCHENCPIINGERFCWGPEADMCQIIHTCSGDETRCTMDNRTCHLQCAAGCNREDNATECLSCRHFARGSECISNCSAPVRRMESDGTTSLIPPLDKYSQGSKCVENCDAGFIWQGNDCVRSCKTGYLAKDKNCIPCKGERPETCPGTGIHSLTKEHLPCLTGCKTIEGNLAIYNESFTRPATDRNSLEIRYSSLTSLGLKSLRRVGKCVVILDNKDLCYTDSFNREIIAKPSTCAFAIQRNKDSEICKNESFVCSPTCEASDGCMGPGDNNCITCAEFNLIDGSCSNNCSTGNGFFINEGKGGNKECLPCDSSCNGSCVKEFVCGECHRECIGCHGLLPTQCHKCRNYRQEKDSNAIECVDNCSKGFYESESKLCSPCHSHCSVCHGSKNDECSECKFVRIYRELRLEPTEKDDSNDTTYKSFCDETCPKGQRIVKVGNQTESVCRTEHPLGSFMEPSTAIPVFVVLFIVIFVSLVLLIVILRKQKLRQLREKILAIDEIPMKNSSGAKPDMASLRLIKESELRRSNMIGSGAFGAVYKGIWIPDKENVKIPVAIKILTEQSNTNLNVELLEEARIMASVCHPNCVRILAVCMTAQMMLITQLMPLGCLLDYVRKERSSIGSRALLLWSVQIAKGMEYLEELGIVHRDLAARNVLVYNPNQVKITDFGLAKLLDSDEEEIHSEGGKMPIKWLALECIQHRIYTHKSDVWSYGVTLWEMFTYGKRPFENLHPRQIPEALEKGERLLQPEICTIDVFMILIKCWMLDVDSRPTFSDLVSDLTRMAEDPGRFLVIQGDGLLRLPSQTPDAEDLIALMSQSFDDPDLMIVSGEDYLCPKNLRFEHNNDYFPSNKSYRCPLASIKENVAYENSELIGGRRAESCTNGNSPMFVMDDDYPPPPSPPIQPRYMDLVYHSTFDNSETDKKPGHGYTDMSVVSGISKDNLTYYDNEVARLQDDANKTDNKRNSGTDTYEVNNN